MQAPTRARRVPVRALAGVALLLAAAADARAEEFPEAPDAPSAFTTVIDASEYDDRFETVADLLDHTAGVRVRRYGPLGASSTASIRGSKPEQVLVLLDGVRLNSAQRGAVDLSTLPLRTIGRIEVIRGGGASRYGSGAVGGVISITTRTPETGQALDASATTGRYETLGADVLLSRRGDHTSALVGYTRLQSQNDFHYQVPSLNQLKAHARLAPDTSTHQRLNADFREESALLRGEWEASPELRRDGTLAWFSKDNGQPGTTRGRDRDPATDEQLSCLGPDEQYRRALVRLSAVRPQLLGGSLSAALSYRLERSELRDPATPGFDVSDCNLVPFSVTRQHRSEAIDQEASIDLAYAGSRTQLGPFGVQNRSAATLRFDHVRTLDAEPHRRAVVTLFSQQEIRLLEGRLRLLPALGFETTRTSDGLARSAGFVDPVETSIDDSAEWLPRIGAILRIAPGLRLKANWLRA